MVVVIVAVVAPLGEVVGVMAVNVESVVGSVIGGDAPSW